MPGVKKSVGRPRKKLPPLDDSLFPDSDDMLTWLQKVALGKVEATPVQVRAAIAAVQYTHTKRCDGGKKEEQSAAAGRVSKGKFAPAEAPKLVVNNR